MFFPPFLTQLDLSSSPVPAQSSSSLTHSQVKGQLPPLITPSPCSEAYSESLIPHTIKQTGIHRNPIPEGALGQGSLGTRKAASTLVPESHLLWKQFFQNVFVHTTSIFQRLHITTSQIQCLQKSMVEMTDCKLSLVAQNSSGFFPNNNNNNNLFCSCHLACCEPKSSYFLGVYTFPNWTHSVPFPLN